MVGKEIIACEEYGLVRTGGLDESEFNPKHPIGNSLKKRKPCTKV